MCQLRMRKKCRSSVRSTYINRAQQLLFHFTIELSFEPRTMGRMTQDPQEAVTMMEAAQTESILAVERFVDRMFDFPHQTPGVREEQEKLEGSLMKIVTHLGFALTQGAVAITSATRVMDELHARRTEVVKRETEVQRREQAMAYQAMVLECERADMRREVDAKDREVEQMRNERETEVFEMELERSYHKAGTWPSRFWVVLSAMMLSSARRNT